MNYEGNNRNYPRNEIIYFNHRFYPDTDAIEKKQEMACDVLRKHPKLYEDLITTISGYIDNEIEDQIIELIGIEIECYFMPMWEEQKEYRFWIDKPDWLTQYQLMCEHKNIETTDEGYEKVRNLF